MSQPPTARKKRDLGRLSVLALSLGIIILAAIMSITVSNLNWPIAAELSGNSGSQSFTSSSTLLYGEIDFTGIALTNLVGTCPNCPSYQQSGGIRCTSATNNTFQCTTNSSQILAPLSGVVLTIVPKNAPPNAQSIQAITNDQGVYFSRLAPGAYSMSLNATSSGTVVQFTIEADSITIINFEVMNTAYPAVFYDFFDQYGAGQIGPWQSLYVGIPSSTFVGNVSSVVQVETTLKATHQGNYTQQNPTQRISSQILDETLARSDLIFDLKPSIPMNSTGILGMDIVYSQSNYTEFLATNVITSAT